MKILKMYLNNSKVNNSFGGSVLGLLRYWTPFLASHLFRGSYDGRYLSPSPSDSLLLPHGLICQCVFASRVMTDKANLSTISSNYCSSHPRYLVMPYFVNSSFW